MQIKRDLRPDPVWFVKMGINPEKGVSGFQQAIGRLKGKLSKASPGCSYQAHSFIIPDPLRRT